MTLEINDKFYFDLKIIYAMLEEWYPPIKWENKIIPDHI